MSSLLYSGRWSWAQGLAVSSISLLYPSSTSLRNPPYDNDAQGATKWGTLLVGMVCAGCAAASYICVKYGAHRAFALAVLL